ncbi:hypothetical protein ASD66_20230 [Nocardioides sp. Root151]|nr:hypothetical protein ASD66_20230 [Nocardioides sp. Root151]
MRGIAILMVLLAHTMVPQVHASGTVGVTMFFTLSGFLITALLLDERAGAGCVSFRAFYVRRALRLLPALLFFLGVVAVLTVVSDSPVMPSGQDFLGAVFYVGNFTTAMQGHDTIIMHTWSLAVEEQFYIVWPLVFVASMRWGRRAVMWAAAAGSAFAIIERLYLYSVDADPLRIIFGTDSRMDGLLVGCLAAAWLSGRPVGRNRPFIAATALGVVLAMSLVGLRTEFLIVTTLVPWLTAAAIVMLVQEPRSGLLTSPIMRLIGQRSYAIYLWHYPILAAAAGVSWPGKAVSFLVAILLTATIVHLSWVCVEEPFLRLKHRRGTPATQPELAVGGAV